jgi:hypothetical protein
VSDRWALSSKTVCVVCGEKIKRGRDSYSCPAPDFVPRHFRCVYPEAKR